MVALKASVAYWKDKKLNELAEKGGLNEKTLMEITKKINGGLTGYDDRKERFFNL
jgi:predicted chitinase